jgi:hypothetical protein
MCIVNLKLISFANLSYRYGFRQQSKWQGPAERQESCGEFPRPEVVSNWFKSKWEYTILWTKYVNHFNRLVRQREIKIKKMLCNSLYNYMHDLQCEICVRAFSKQNNYLLLKLLPLAPLLHCNH